MLERIDGVAMNDEAKNHWKGIAHFFRALQYFRLVQNFGDVPWYGHSVEIEDSAQLYKPRDPRKLVMDSVLDDINFAVNNFYVLSSLLLFGFFVQRTPSECHYHPNGVQLGGHLERLVLYSTKKH